MTKALLSNINSLWGVIINPQRSNTYRHILSFKNQEIKDQYISNELFNGTNYKQLIETQPNISLTQLTASKAMFRVNVSDYQNESLNSLLNKDFAIIKENNQFRFYTLQGTAINNGLVEYIADLDIFFTYDIKEMFNDKPVMLERAMIDRFKKDTLLNKYVPKIYSEAINKQDSLILFNEPFQIQDENLIMKDQPEELLQDYDNLFKAGTSFSDMLFCKSKIDKMKIMVLYRTIGTDASVKNITLLGSTTKPERILRKDNSGTWLPYATILGVELDVFDVNNIKWYFNTDGTFDIPTSKNGMQVNGFSKDHVEEPDTLPNSYTISPFTILTKLKPENTQITRSGNDVIIVTKASKNQNWDNDLTIIPAQYTDAEYKMGCFVLKSQDSQINKLPKSKEFTIKPLPIFELNDLLITNKVKDNNYKTEIKSYFSPFRKLILRGATKLTFPLSPQLFTKNKIELKYSFSYIPELWNMLAIPLNYNIPLGTISESTDFQNKTKFLEDVAPYGLPTEKNAYTEYMNSHRSQMTAGIFNSATSAMGGVVTGMVTANPFAVVSSVLGFVSSVNQTLALEADLKRIPLQLQQTSSVLQRDYSFMTMKPTITEEVLSPYMMNHIRQFLYKYGYNLSGYQDNINNYLNNRYYFNYIQAPETFENNKLQASSEIKQIINDTLAEGVTVWNVRDLTTFKGIKNYEYENTEMSLLS